MRLPLSPIAVLWLLPTAGAALVPLGVTVLPPDKPSSTDARDVTDVLSRASAVALAEVVSVSEYNGQPHDGPLEHVVKLRIVKSSGEPPAKIDIIIAWEARGGRSEPATKPQAPARVPLFPNPLIVGQRYWFAWSSVHEMNKFPNHIIAWWIEDAAPVKALEDALRTDRYQWQPQYEPTTGRRYGHSFDEKANATSVRVWINDKLLWERTLSGKLREFNVSTRERLGLPVAQPGGSSLVFYPINSGTQPYLDFDTGIPVLPPGK
jgi:hypothetical protein